MFEEKYLKGEIWTDEEYEFCVTTIVKAINEGRSLSSALRDCSQHLNRTLSALRNRWNVKLKYMVPIEVRQHVRSNFHGSPLTEVKKIEDDLIPAKRVRSTKNVEFDFEKEIKKISNIVSKLGKIDEKLLTTMQNGISKYDFERDILTKRIEEKDEIITILKKRNFVLENEVIRYKEMYETLRKTIALLEEE